VSAGSVHARSAWPLACLWDALIWHGPWWLDDVCVFCICLVVQRLVRCLLIALGFARRMRVVSFGVISDVPDSRVCARAVGAEFNLVSTKKKVRLRRPSAECFASLLLCFVSYPDICLCVLLVRQPECCLMHELILIASVLPLRVPCVRMCKRAHHINVMIAMVHVW
jgi:hypothetical protein